jgi:hypothetical protein
VLCFPAWPQCVVFTSRLAGTHSTQRST